MLKSSSTARCFVATHLTPFHVFELLGATVLSVHVDYPPRRCEVLDDLSVVRDKRVLILEDDVISGVTLGYVVQDIQKFQPRSMDLYLGRPADGQLLKNVDPAIGQTYLAEDHLDSGRRAEYEADFVEFFAG